VGRGNLEQTLFNMAVPPSLRRGDVEVLIAQQQLNVAVVEQFTRRSVAFYAALYNRSLQSIRNEQLQELQENVATQKNRFEAGLAIEAHSRAQRSKRRTRSGNGRRATRVSGSAIEFGASNGDRPGTFNLCRTGRRMKFVPARIDVVAETPAALSAGSISNSPACLCALQMKIRYYMQPTIIQAGGKHPRGYGFRSGIHRQESTRKTQDF
jgi:hypothetical protein